MECLQFNSILENSKNQETNSNSGIYRYILIENIIKDTHTCEKEIN